MIKVVYSSPYVPPELVEACGAVPERIIDFGDSKERISEGMCPYARAFRDAVSVKDHDIVLFTTGCDQMRRGYESPEELPNSYLLNIPSTWQSLNAFNLYISEMERMAGIICQSTGVELREETLKNVMIKYDSSREKLREYRNFVDSAEYNKQVLNFIANIGSVPELSERYLSDNIPLALIGGPLTKNDLSLFNIIRDLGGDIAVNGTENGDMNLPDPFDKRNMAIDSWQELMDTYFFKVADIGRRPNSHFYSMLKSRLDENGVRGVIYRSYPWCDLWGAEVYRIKEWLDIPLLEIDAELFRNPDHEPRLITRLEAFMETLNEV